MLISAPLQPGLRASGWVPRALAAVHQAVAGLDWSQAPALLLARLYVAQVFWLSGLTKIRDWETTLALFENEYQVPLLSPVLAAWMGTAGELALPVLLVLGLGGRFAALGLSVVNVMAVLSLPDMPPAARSLHDLWGVLLLMVVLFGPGRWALDHWIQRWLRSDPIR